MTIRDVRGDWPCGWCDTQRVTKRGTICIDCQLKLDAYDHLDRAGAQMRLLEDDRVGYARPWQDVLPRSEFL